MSFTAKFPGTCDYCGGRIEPGQQIRTEDPDERTYVHVDPPCPPRPPTPPVCFTCWTELPVSGICGVCG